MRPAGIVADPRPVTEAVGVDIRRSIGGDQFVLLDPFLLLDYLRIPPAPDGQTAGFLWHPHRGIETLTYVVAGRVHHRDSLGNDDWVQDGESQWMTAGGGIFHEEMLEPGAAGSEALQVWFNLPAAGKMKPPGYAAARTDAIPEVALPGGAAARVVSGTLGGAVGPFTGIAVSPTYLDVVAPAGSEVSLPAPAGAAAFAFVYRGRPRFGEGGGAAAQAPQLVVFGDGETVLATAGEEPARFVFVSAMPLREPVLQYRSIVMNTVDEMRQAIADLESGAFAGSL